MAGRPGRDGSALPLLLLALAVTAVIACAAPAFGEDVEVSSTFLTFFDNGGGYIEYHLSGDAARAIRERIDDPVMDFPFENVAGDMDGTIDQAEGQSFLDNLDATWTKREMVLRGVKMENVDVDEHSGLMGSEVNSSTDIYIHITFRGEIHYGTFEFNVSGLEPLGVLFGNYTAIPRTLTVSERTYIVAAGTASYKRVQKESGSLWNLRLPMAHAVSYHSSYTTSDPPVARMEYTHSSALSNPIALMLLMFVCTFLTLKLPKILARENDKELLRMFHLTLLVVTVIVWLVYFLGGAAGSVWFGAIAMTVGSYLMAHMIYAKDWRGMAVPSGEIEVANGLEAADPEAGGPIRPSGDAFDGFERERPVGLVTATDLVVDGQGDDPDAADGPAIGETGGGVAPPAGPDKGAAPQVMRCSCGGAFKVPPEPRPITVKCPHCGRSGVIR